MRALFLALAAALWSGPLQAADCAPGNFEGVPYVACVVDPRTEDLRLWHADADGAPWSTFTRLDEALSEQGERLAVAMNGAMYHPDRSPVGHYVEEAEARSGLVTSPGPGNFGLLPNGLFCLGPEIGSRGAAVIETTRFAEARPPCRFAMQSGPMLVIGGDLHPRFLPGSDSRHIRNGVGVRADGRVVLAISDAPVNFHRFARLFRDELGAPDALYIDGKVSRLWAPAIGRRDFGLPLGPILGVAVPAE